MTDTSRFRLFQAYGVELEYMIVDRDNLGVKSVADELLKHKLGQYESDFVNGPITWSNELVLHVIEIKSTQPEQDFVTLGHSFQQNVQTINSILKEWNAMLMPTGAHPFMNPMTQTRLWPHGSNDVYAQYNKIFNCHGHGWSNLQSVHINLPFHGDEEFARLHAAIRVILPLLPGLCASTPILDGRFTGTFDTRLKYYKLNQARIPSITGRVIPEGVFSESEYQSVIYDQIQSDLTPYDPEGILNPTWVNSRGAIARFDRGSIEIRIMDCQESPVADLALARLVVEAVKALAEEKFVSLEQLKQWDTESLAAIYDSAVEGAGDAVIQHQNFLSLFGITSGQATVKEVWLHLQEVLSAAPSTQLDDYASALNHVLSQGTLAQRIVRAIDNNFSHGNVTRVYRQLCECLSKGALFVP